MVARETVAIALPLTMRGAIQPFPLYYPLYFTGGAYTLWSELRLLCYSCCCPPRIRGRMMMRIRRKVVVRRRRLHGQFPQSLRRLLICQPIASSGIRGLNWLYTLIGK